MPSRTSSGLRVAVTGAAGAIGSELVERLAAWDAVETVVALDLRPIAPSSGKVVSYQHDVTQPMDAVLHAHDVSIVVHLAWVLRPGRDRDAARRVNVGGTAQVLQGCHATGVGHVLHLSSATVYGAHRDNAVPLLEDATLRPVRGFQYAEDKVEAEGLMEQYRSEHPDAQVTVLRGCVVMGEESANFITEALSKPVLAGVLGHDPPMQFLHQEDLQHILLHFLAHPRNDVYNVAGQGTVRYSEMVKTAGKRLLWLPGPLLRPLVQATWALHLQSDSPAAGLEMVRWPWVVSTQKLERETGLHPRHTSLEALQASLLANGLR